MQMHGQVVRCIFFLLVSTSLNQEKKGCRFHPSRGRNLPKSMLGARTTRFLQKTLSSQISFALSQATFELSKNL